jgi:hypothetical protein
MKRYAIEDVHETDPEASGIRPSQDALDLKKTGKVPREALDRLLAEDRRRAQAEQELEDQSDRTRVISRAWVLPPSEIVTPQRLELDLPVDVIAQGRFATASIPPPPIPPFELRRAARDEARRTKRIVVAIWAFALTLAGGLGYFVALQD